MQVEVFYLKNGDFYTDGQNLIKKEMNKDQIDYYLSSMKSRSLEFTAEREIIEVNDPDLVDYYRDSGYKIIM